MHNIKQKFHLSEDGYQFLLSQEKVRRKPFRDTNGFFTVGISHNGPEVNPLHTYTDEEIKMLFESDKKRIEEDVNKIFDPLFMNQNMFDACFSFAFDIGNISQTELGKLIQKNPYDDRIRETWAYAYTEGQKNKKLMTRRLKELKLYYTDYDS